MFDSVFKDYKVFLAYGNCHATSLLNLFLTNVFPVAHVSSEVSCGAAQQTCTALINPEPPFGSASQLPIVSCLMLLSGLNGES